MSVSRRMDDGTYLGVQSVYRHPELVHVNIASPNGNPMYVGVMSVVEALAEIPYQMDRGRRVAREMADG